MKPILFYSKKCVNCKNLWRMLIEKNQLEQFIKICIDSNNKIPSNITSVPAILLKGRAPMFGNAIGMFLNTKNSDIGVPKSSKPNFQKAPVFNKHLDGRPKIKTSTNGLENILDFNPIEMSANLSDSYSFIQNNPSPMDFCYEFISNSQKTDDDQRMPQQKTKNNLDDRLQQLQTSRRQLIQR